MRLKILESGHAEEQKQYMARITAQGGRLSDMMKVVLYRPNFFGLSFMAACNAVLHEQPSFWTQGERELFAAFASNLNKCKF
ncbi:MAG TPA: hypothetical protein VKT82_26895 [Ktedonobacterales bacterium]|nr:hypothetical protein [Ktedonobacterales bacterium]